MYIWSLQVAHSEGGTRLPARSHALFVHPTPPHPEARSDVADEPRDGRDVVGLVEVPTGGPGEVLCEPRRVATPRRRRARDVLLLFVFPFPLLVIRTMDLNELFSF